MVVFIISYTLGASMETGEEQSSLIKKQFEEKVKNINELGIFQNNAAIALGMFIPGLGIGLGIFSGFGTGLVFSAMAATDTTLQNISPLAILITPFGIMEVFSYGLAMSRSGILIYDLFIKKIPWRQFLKPTIIEITIVVVILLVAAFIEWNMIKMFVGPTN